MVGDIQVVSRGTEWVVIQRGHLDDLSFHPTMDEATLAGQGLAKQLGVNFIPF